MDSNQHTLARNRSDLTAELTRIRRESMRATERRDFRAVARLTLEAARINRAIADSLTKDEMAS